MTKKSVVQQRPPSPREAIPFARRHFHGARAVGSFLPALTTKAMQKYGFSAASLIIDWPAIAGGELARYAAPERLKWPRVIKQDEGDDAESPVGRRPGAVLVLRVDGAKALDVQYRAGQIIERINAYFGYAAVAQIRVIQAPLPAAPSACKPRARAELSAHDVAGIADAALRDALARLGAEIRTSG